MKKYFIIGICVALISGSVYGDPLLPNHPDPYIIEPFIECHYSYNCGDGTGNEPIGGSFEDYYDINLEANTCSKTGFVFGGWQSSLSGVVYQPGDTYSFNDCSPDGSGGTVQFVAVWSVMLMPKQTLFKMHFWEMAKTN